MARIEANHDGRPVHHGSVGYGGIRLIHFASTPRSIPPVRQADARRLERAREKMRRAYMARRRPRD